MHCLRILVVVFLALVPAGYARAAATDGSAERQTVPFEILEAGIPQLQIAMGTGQLTARQLLDYYLARIAAFDRAGPKLNAVAVINPAAQQIADALDRERADKGPRGPLHGIPIIVKDNYETIGMPTTVGSVLLEGFQPDNDALQVSRLRAAGAIIIGKANMHEWAYGITTVGSAP